MLTDSTFWDRAFFFALGIVLGFILGLVTFAWKEARKARDEAAQVHQEIVRLDQKVTDLVEHEDHTRNEDGLLHTRVWGNVALVIVVLISLYAAFSSQAASHHTNNLAEYTNQLVKDNIEQTNEIQRTQDCTESTVNEALQIIAKRTRLNGKSSLANLNLQKAQAKFLGVSSTTSNQAEVMKAFEGYVDALSHFVDVATKVSLKGQDYPYPKAEEYRHCLEKSRE